MTQRAQELVQRFQSFVNDPHSPYGMTSAQVARNSARDGVQRSNPLASHIQAARDVMVANEIAAVRLRDAQAALEREGQQATLALNEALDHRQDVRSELNQAGRAQLRNMAHTICWKNIQSGVNEEYAHIAERCDKLRRALGYPVVDYNDQKEVDAGDHAEEPHNGPFTDAEEVSLQAAAEANLECARREAMEAMETHLPLEELLRSAFASQEAEAGNDASPEQQQEQQPCEFSSNAFVLYTGFRPRSSQEHPGSHDNTELESDFLGSLTEPRNDVQLSSDPGLHHLSTFLSPSPPDSQDPGEPSVRR